MGGKSEAGRGGSIGASAHVVIPLLHALAAGGCAEGRSVENGRKEREGEKGSAWAALQQLQQPVRTKEGRKRRLQDCPRGSIFIFLHVLKKKTGLGLMRKPFFHPW